MDKACYDAIGRRIRYVRHGKKLTQEQVAERAGISANYLSRIENGTAKFSLEVLIQLINALDISAGYLLLDVIKKKEGEGKGMDVQNYDRLPEAQIEFINQFIGLARQYHILK